jgi:hypothetical protein
MTFTAFHAAQDCRAIGPTAQIVAVNTQAEDQDIVQN